MIRDVIRDEGHLQEPYLGGYNSAKSVIMTVEFIPDPGLY